MAGSPAPFAPFEWMIAWRYLRAKRAEGGTVSISAQLDETRLRIAVTDDGGGLDGSPHLLIRDGNGLGNVRRRLDSFFKGKAALELTRNPTGRGAQAILVLPAAGARESGGTGRDGVDPPDGAEGETR